MFRPSPAEVRTRRPAAAARARPAGLTRWPARARVAQIDVTTTTDRSNSDSDCSLRRAIRGEPDTAQDACPRVAGSATDDLALERCDVLAHHPATGGDTTSQNGDLDVLDNAGAALDASSSTARPSRQRAPHRRQLGAHDRRLFQGNIAGNDPARSTSPARRSSDSSFVDNDAPAEAPSRTSRADQERCRSANSCFVGNRDDAIDSFTAASPARERSNWWGDVAGGPSANGDTVVGNVATTGFSQHRQGLLAAGAGDARQLRTDGDLPPRWLTASSTSPRPTGRRSASVRARDRGRGVRRRERGCSSSRTQRQRRAAKPSRVPPPCRRQRGPPVPAAPADPAARARIASRLRCRGSATSARGASTSTNPRRVGLRRSLAIVAVIAMGVPSSARARPDVRRRRSS